MRACYQIALALVLAVALPLGAQSGYEIRGASGGTNVVYLHTTIETPELFAQALAWTVPSQEAAMRKKLEKAILSIRPID